MWSFETNANSILTANDMYDYYSMGMLFDVNTVRNQNLTWRKLISEAHQQLTPLDYENNMPCLEIWWEDCPWLVVRSHESFRVTSSGHHRPFAINGCHIPEDMRFISRVSIVLADGLAPLGTRQSAGTVVSEFRFCMYSGPALQWLALAFK